MNLKKTSCRYCEKEALSDHLKVATWINYKYCFSHKQVKQFLSQFSKKKVKQFIHFIWSKIIIAYVLPTKLCNVAGIQSEWEELKAN